MPIYEFYCPDCNTLYSFLSRKVTTSETPPCPRCKRESLRRQVSMFSAVTGKSKEEGDIDTLGIDETKMTHALEKLAGEAEGINEEDPRQAARMMRKLADMTGLKYQDSIENALSRLEAGEDPDTIESEMGETLENGDPFVLPGQKRSPRNYVPPIKDDTLYEM